MDQVFSLSNIVPLIIRPTEGYNYSYNFYT